MKLDDHIIKQCCLKSTIFEDKFSLEQLLKGRAFDDEDAAMFAQEEEEELEDHFNHEHSLGN